MGLEVIRKDPVPSLLPIERVVARSDYLPEAYFVSVKSAGKDHFCFTYGPDADPSDHCYRFGITGEEITRFAFALIQLVEEAQN